MAHLSEGNRDCLDVNMLYAHLHCIKSHTQIYAHTHTRSQTLTGLFSLADH